MAMLSWEIIPTLAGQRERTMNGWKYSPTICVRLLLAGNCFSDPGVPGRLSGGLEGVQSRDELNAHPKETCLIAIECGRGEGDFHQLVGRVIARVPHECGQRGWKFALFQVALNQL